MIFYLSNDTAALPVKSKRGKGGPYKIALDRWEVENIQALAQCMGQSLGSFVRGELRRAMNEMAARLKIGPFAATGIPRKRRMEIGRAIRDTHRKTCCRDEGLN